ncbi:hypothetical protein DUI87_31063 [Hirundo rustica rustica]|uniref:Uncharacterized protein n=1 Tax=Hirundo rustica rustica TaxID=333673 RepID=A0A3M0J0I8_HIRRU|nr:hypothetical protein DUI87_31063 [Hirundo rustica rustica]
MVSWSGAPLDILITSNAKYTEQSLPLAQPKAPGRTQCWDSLKPFPLVLSLHAHVKSPGVLRGQERGIAWDYGAVEIFQAGRMAKKNHIKEEFAYKAKIQPRSPEEPYVT